MMANKRQSRVTNSSKKTTIAASVTILGVVMIFIGASLFTYSGPRLHPIIYAIGKWSFFLCIPTFLIGVISLVIVSWKPDSKKRNKL